MNLPPISQLPWAVGHDRFLSAAAAVTGEGACCLFVIDESIPSSARPGYAALVIAYARASEPVTILEGGAAALLIREGGVSAAQVAARRLLNQMSKLGLQATLRAGVAPLTGGVDDAIATARALATGASAGEVAVAA
jgi:predicted ABC-type transport system involved in lysophospholipase L1 biosynthesis ATPase subunit